MPTEAVTNGPAGFDVGATAGLSAGVIAAALWPVWISGGAVSTDSLDALFLIADAAVGGDVRPGETARPVRLSSVPGVEDDGEDDGEDEESAEAPVGVFPDVPGPVESAEAIPEPAVMATPNPTPNASALAREATLAVVM